MSWAAQTMYGFDLETTGLDVFEDRIVTATIVRLDDDQVGTTKEWLADPGIEIPEGAAKIHGVTTEHAREHGRPALEVVADVADTVVSFLRSGVPFVIMNAAYDLSLLEAECRRHDLPSLFESLHPTQFQGLIDPMVLVKGNDTRRRDFQKGRKYTLPAMCERFGVPFEETHQSTADAVGAVRLARAVAAKYSDLADLTPERIHTTQKTWRRDGQASFRRWVEREGKQDQYGDIDGGWPLHSRLQAVTA